MAGKSLDEISLLNQRWDRDGTGMLVFGGMGSIFNIPLGK